MICLWNEDECACCKIYDKEMHDIRSYLSKSMKSRIEKTVKNKFPKDMISALTELKEQAEKVIEKKPKKNSHFDAQSFSD